MDLTWSSRVVWSKARCAVPIPYPCLRTKDRPSRLGCRSEYPRTVLGRTRNLRHATAFNVLISVWYFCLRFRSARVQPASIPPIFLPSSNLAASRAVSLSVSIAEEIETSRAKRNQKRTRLSKKRGENTPDKHGGKTRQTSLSKKRKCDKGGTLQKHGKT